MHGAVVAIVIIVVRVILARRRGQRTFIDWALPAGLGLFLVRVIALMLAIGIYKDDGSTWFACFYLLVATLHPITRWFVVPLGLPHVSYWLTRTAFFGLGKSEAIFNELKARLRRGQGLEPEQLELFAQGLFKGETDRKMRGTSVAVRAMLDALASDLEQARLLFRLTAELNWRLAPRYVRSYAQAWLLADAARRGAWYEVVQLSRQGPLTRRAFFYRAAAQRILQTADAPSELVLAGAWLVAPSRRASLPLFDCARTATPRLALEVTAEELTSLKRCTYAALRRSAGTVTRPEIRALADAWQRLFERGEHQELLNRRAKELGAEIDSAQVASEFETDVVELLKELWRTSLPDPSPADDDPALLVAAKDDLQFELLGEFETIAGALPKEDDEEDCDCDDFEPSWRTWARLRAVASAYLWHLPERAALLCDAGCEDILNHGAWLYNQKKARALAHDVFRWLLPRFPKRSENHRTVKRNIRISQDA